MAQQSKAAFDAALSTYINDNTNGEVTPADHRTVETNMSDSVLWLEGSSALTAVTPATDDKVVIRDTSDSDNLKTVTAQSIADLATTSGIVRTTINLSSGQILALNTTPIELIAAPGSGNIISVVSQKIFFKYATPYSTNVNLRIRYSGGQSMGIYTGLLSSTNDQTRTSFPSLNAQTPLNESYEVTVDTGDPTGGTSTIKIVIYYQIESV